MWRIKLPAIFHTKFLRSRFSSSRTLSSEADPLYADVPKPRRDKSERKAYPTPMKVLIQRAKEEREEMKANPCRLLEEAPANGLLVPELVEVAHRVYHARESVLLGLSKLVKVIPVQRCRHCYEVHIGHVGHEIRTCTGPSSGLRRATHVWRRGSIRDVIYFPTCFHLLDRVGKPRVTHNERHSIKRIPAIVELCVQAGLDLENYPTKRRMRPVYSIEGRIVDFDLEIEKDKNGILESEPTLNHPFNPFPNSELEEGKSLGELSSKILKLWFEMMSGAKKLMEKYKVQTCGYCPEVQVGPKGHKVRMCRASKHQSRDGMHAWQEATIDDLVGPNYVWHVKDLSGPPLVNDLKRYFGKAPAIVELCVQAGTPVPDQYKSMMRLDVVPPSCDEWDLVT